MRTSTFCIMLICVLVGLAQTGCAPSPGAARDFPQASGYSTAGNLNETLNVDPFTPQSLSTPY